MNKKINFETAIKELEKILYKVENNKLSLEELVDAFERGTELSHYCLKELDDAKIKITSLKK